MNISATELPNFIRKYYLLHELLIFKYWRQNISVSNIVLHTAVRHSGVQPTEHVRQCTVNSWNTRLHHSSSLASQQFRLPDLGKLQDRVYRSQIRDVDQLKLHLIEEYGEHFHQVVIDEVVRYVFELAFDFEHTVDILNTDFRCTEVLPFARTHTWQSITPGHLCFWVTLLNLLYCSCCSWLILLKFGDLFAI